jgi:hypothetical protein
MKNTIITCDGCGASTSEAMRPDGWACLHVFLYDTQGEPKFEGTQDRCARCMIGVLAPDDERRERPTLPDQDRPAPQRCVVHHNGAQCRYVYAHIGPHQFE